MYQYKKITEDMYWIGGNDRRLALFENVFPVPEGVSYNSYFIDDEKTTVVDTVDKSVCGVFFENLEKLLGGRRLDYVIVNHMEPDHCATLSELVLRYPDVKVVCNPRSLAMIKQFFSFDIDSRAVAVKEGETLSTGKHTLTFLMAPMVHWPEVMMTYDSADKVLFSADAFGSFGAINGNIFADEIEFGSERMSEARRYYTNIVGKYGTQVQAILQKATKLEISMICSLHGHIWRKNIGNIVEKYNKWSTYTPEDNAVVIAYASVYGNTENAAFILASRLSDMGVKNISMFDVSVTHPSYIVAECFRCSHLVFASTTYNAGIFCNMETLLLDLKAHNLCNRTVALIENGSWAATSGKLMTGIFEQMYNMNIIGQTVSLRSSLHDEQIASLEALAEEIYNSIPKADTAKNDGKIAPDAMFKLSYGLFVLSAKDGDKDNACIINTAMQVTDSPKRISIAVNKANLTHDMITSMGEFNLSVLTTDTPFSVFERFGFHSGRDVDKFEGDTPVRSENGIVYIPEFANAVLSGKVISSTDLGTHTEFIAEITEAKTLSGVPSATYQYYFDNIKPKPQPVGEEKKGYVCKICGYVYEGDELPEDFICPLCKHGAEDFEKL